MNMNDNIMALNLASGYAEHLVDEVFEGKYPNLKNHINKGVALYEKATKRHRTLTVEQRERVKRCAQFAPDTVLGCMTLIQLCIDAVLRDMPRTEKYKPIRAEFNRANMALIAIDRRNDHDAADSADNAAEQFYKVFKGE